jgi:anti-sigma factor RsiW
MRPPLDCARARLELLDYQRGRLDPGAATMLANHLERCPDCAHEDAAERLLTEQLEERLPRYAAPFGLTRRLAAQRSISVGGPAPRPAGLARWLGLVAAVLLVALLAGIALWRPAPPDGVDRLVAEAVNNHLRLLARSAPLDVQSDDMHRVRPWFSGRLDFAPVVGFAGDSEFPLHGGTVEYFLDRRAAALVYGRRLHRVSLFVFRAEGLEWPPHSSPPVHATVRGFSVQLWRSGELGYALVSDLNPTEMARLAERLRG